MKTYTEEFKKTIVELYENGNKNKSELAREYGTSEGNVRAWIKKYGKIKTSTGEITSNVGKELFYLSFRKLLLLCCNFLNYKQSVP